MILFELTQDEQHPAYQSLEIANGERHYSFLKSMVAASLSVERHFLSETLIKAINYHAIACLHTNPGEYRPCPVTVDEFKPPEHYRVPALMDDFVNLVNRAWEGADAVALSAFVVWRLNNIHPFINGNGRTARASSYFVLCIKAGGWLKGDIILPQLLRRERPRYVAALKAADASAAAGQVDLGPLHSLMSELLAEQLGLPDPNQNGNSNGNDDAT